ncbi:Polar amino acid uptake family ABC transporter, periplasmic substrate-binding protein [Mesorhizobium plurifarium]|uniref:Polar amino acid uptake family ABC transporter, periplasmic substrate-binding protein n=1 Tax=Mesorhizobium plurifarium TaxID=69974 RepID=A0A090DRE5_MESPL|nr:Polar amino acid uptake family ABC transporter, periplasmic substrate-binding protein [Mesorhizobium plurifarium]
MKILSGRRWLMAALMALVAPTLCAAQSLEDVRKAGTLTIGVKADSKPWAYLNEAGEPIGWEIDLAKAIAKELKVEPKLVIVTSASRIQFLEQGMIDMVLATMSDTPERRRVVHMVEPPYFADATNLLMRKDTPIDSWDDLKNRKVCGVQGSIYNKPLQQKRGAEVLAFAGLTEAFAALKNGTCEGVVYADQILRQTAASEDWQDYTVKLDPIDEIPWAIAIRKDEADSELSKELSSIIAKWHRTGYLLETAGKWGLGSNPFLNRKKGGD